MGDPLPVVIKLDIPAAIKELRLEYTDACGHLTRIPLGARLEEALVEAADKTFTSVSYEGRANVTARPEATVRVDLENSSFTLQQSPVRGRIPANLQLNAIARVIDKNGNTLRESAVTTVR